MNPQDARKNQVSTGGDGGGNLRGDFNEETAEEIRHHYRPRPIGLPSGDVGPLDGDASHLIDLEIFFRCADGVGVEVSRFRFLCSQHPRGDGEDAAPAAKVEDFPRLGADFMADVGEEAEASGSGGVVASAEGHPCWDDEDLSFAGGFCEGIFLGLADHDNEFFADPNGRSRGGGDGARCRLFID